MENDLRNALGAAMAAPAVPPQGAVAPQGAVVPLAHIVQLLGSRMPGNGAPLPVLDHAGYLALDVHGAPWLFRSKALGGADKWQRMIPPMAGDK